MVNSLILLIFFRLHNRIFVFVFLGGATFWGLGSLLTSAKEYDELLELAAKGDYEKVCHYFFIDIIFQKIKCLKYRLFMFVFLGRYIG